MKNKIIFITVSITIMSAMAAFLVFLTQKGNLVSLPLESSLGPELQFREESEDILAQPEVQPAEKTPEYTKYTTVDTEYFNLTLPSGWEMISEENTLPIIVADSNEEIANEKVKEINFRTNLSINRAELGEILFKDYVETLKASLINTIPIIEITEEKKAAVSGREAYFMEIESVQEDLRFYTFVVLVQDKENSVWAFSFNTLEESQPKYKNIFYETIENLEMK